MPLKVHTLLEEINDIELREKKIPNFQEVLSPVDKKIRYVLSPKL